MLTLQSIIPELIKQLTQNPCVILQAPPGSGKTTQIPLALLQSGKFNGKIIMLEPRRLAAKSSARYMASLLGEEAGQTVGYRIRLDTKVGVSTQIEIVTEGVLTRILQSDPTLEEYALVIFDEFHERSLQADLGLALCRQVQEVLREDLPILIMSATLESERLAINLGNQVPILTASGRPFTVTTQYLAPAPQENLYRHMANVIQQTLKKEKGNILAFLPGASEIRKVSQFLEAIEDSHVQVLPLFGNLPFQQQEMAIQPTSPPFRKVVLATNIAETSLTIEGIRIVIDSGLTRIPLFDPASGLSRLSTQRISTASAIQRQGRAGRLEEGICIRLWPKSEDNQLIPEIMPEILNADLSSLILELAQWGIENPEELFWLTPPPPTSVAQASELLHYLQALDKNKITEHGKKMLQLPLNPRFSHMILKAKEFKLGGLACTLAALLSERDLLAGKTQQVALELRLEALSKGYSKAQYIFSSAKQIASYFGITPQLKPLKKIGLLLGFAYPDRLAQLRSHSTNQYLLSGGRGAFLNEDDYLAKTPWLVAIHLDGNPKEARIYMATPITQDELSLLTAEQTIEEEELLFNSLKQKVEGKRIKRFKHLILNETPLNHFSQEQISQALLEGIKTVGIKALSWSKNHKLFRERVNFIHHYQPEWPQMNDEKLLNHLEQWLGPFLSGVKRLSEITPEILQQGLEYYLGYDKLAQLEQLAPTHYEVPSGSNIRLDYSQDIPILAVRLQEVFGMESTPRLLNQQVPIMIHLLSPAQRPVQITQDLANFWKDTYQEVRKELKGRYPKHYWPENPLQAQAIRGVKRKP